MDDTTSSDFPPHHQLAHLLQDYRFDPKPLSTTNMSQVYLATDRKLHHRKVAVKIMAGSLAMHPGYRKRFLREIQLMASLEHPNIIYVISAAAEDDRLLYLVMPRAERDMRALLRDGPLDLAGTVDIVTQVAGALDYAHDHGVVHRDVKPGNILFGRDGHVYLCDFGVAKEHFGEDLTATGETIGTRRYTAPEVYGAARPDTAPEDTPVPSARLLPATPLERSGDVYALGAVLYHCLTGRRPFDHPDDSAAEAAQRRGDLAPPSGLRPELEPALDGVVAKAMHLDPEQRYRTCGELAAALTHAAGLTEDGSALPILRDIQERLRIRSDDRTNLTPVLSDAVPASRPPLFTGLTAVIALVLLAGLLVFTLFDLGPEDGTADSAAGDGGVAASQTESPSADTSPSPERTVEPVTGDERVERYPLEGECLEEDPDDYIVVACDSEAADELVFKIVRNPEDPNPSQPEHEDAAWLACGDEGFDYEYIWSDSATQDDTAWDPETDRIYWFMCYRNL